MRELFIIYHPCAWVQYFLFLSLPQTSSSEEMGSLVPTLSSTISRLNFFPKPLFSHTNIRGFRVLEKLQHKRQRPTFYSFNSSSKSLSTANTTMFTSNFSSPKPHNQNPVAANENLVILGIETSCDDTAAAVVISLSLYICIYACIIMLVYIGSF